MNYALERMLAGKRIQKENKMTPIKITVNEVTPFNMRDFLQLMKEYRSSMQLPQTKSYDDALQTLLIDASLGQAWLITANRIQIGFALASYIYLPEYDGRIALLTSWHMPLIEYSSLVQSRLTDETITAIADDLQSTGSKAMAIPLSILSSVYIDGLTYEIDNKPLSLPQQARFCDNHIALIAPGTSTRWQLGSIDYIMWQFYP
ncbi:hypothetical protein [Polycladidibacter stylochi]|uniref:hypothetical protein n=1 Tax=Polycladidibacter stylochi TaxID=1807766 RepID=UPI00082BE243|nr:hypothetical protein [Pseudovibrio stylochi]